MTVFIPYNFKLCYMPMVYTHRSGTFLLAVDMRYIERNADIFGDQIASDNDSLLKL